MNDPKPIDPASPPQAAPGHALGGALGAALEADFTAFRERMLRGLGIDLTDPDTAALFEEVAADGLPDHWSNVQLPSIDPDHPLIKLEGAHRARLESEATDQ